MALVKDAGRRQLAWYVRNCLTGAAGHRLQAAAAAQLEVLRGDAEFGDGFPDDGDLRTPTAPPPGDNRQTSEVFAAEAARVAAATRTTNGGSRAAAKPTRRLCPPSRRFSPRPKGPRKWQRNRRPRSPAAPPAVRCCTS